MLEIPQRNVTTGTLMMETDVIVIVQSRSLLDLIVQTQLLKLTFQRAHAQILVKMESKAHQKHVTTEIMSTQMVVQTFVQFKQVMCAQQLLVRSLHVQLTLVKTD